MDLGQRKHSHMLSKWGGMLCDEPKNRLRRIQDSEGCGHKIPVTFLTVLTLKSSGTPTAVSPVCETGLTGCVIRAKVASTKVLNRRKRKS